MKEFQIRDNEAGQRFDKYLSKLLRNAPKSFFYKMLRKKNITLNGKKATGNEKLEAGDQVKLFLSDETFDKFSQQDKAARAVTTLDVLYEDADVLLINKPAGMLSQPDDTKEPSMVEYVIGYLLEKGELTEEDLLIETAQTEGYVTESEGETAVVLDTNLTPELIEEGFVREIISKVQTMRKEAGFEVMDKIRVSVKDNDKIIETMKANEAEIKSEVLAEEVVYGETDGYVKEWNINKEHVTLGVTKL